MRSFSCRQTGTDGTTSRGWRQGAENWSMTACSVLLYRWSLFLLCSVGKSEYSSACIQRVRDWRDFSCAIIELAAITRQCPEFPRQFRSYKLKSFQLEPRIESDPLNRPSVNLESILRNSRTVLSKWSTLRLKELLISFSFFFFFCYQCIAIQGTNVERWWLTSFRGISFLLVTFLSFLLSTKRAVHSHRVKRSIIYSNDFRYSTLDNADDLLRNDNPIMIHDVKLIWP